MIHYFAPSVEKEQPYANILNCMCTNSVFLRVSFVCSMTQSAKVDHRSLPRVSPGFFFFLSVFFRGGAKLILVLDVHELAKGHNATQNCSSSNDESDPKMLAISFFAQTPVSDPFFLHDLTCGWE
jgi:hypothetical protein